MNELANSGTTIKGRTVKLMLEDLDAVLDEIEVQVRMIADAVYRGCEPTQCRDGEGNEPMKTPPMTVIIENNVARAGALLNELVEIREAMW